MNKEPHCESTCQEDIKEGDREIWRVVIPRQDPIQLNLLSAYKGKQIPEFHVSLGQSYFRSRSGRNGDLRAKSHPAGLLSVLIKADRFICHVFVCFVLFFKVYLLFSSKYKEAKVIKC